MPDDRTSPPRLNERAFRETVRRPWPSFLAVEDIVAITGWHHLTVHRWLRDGVLTSGLRTEHGTGAAWGMWREDLFRQIDPHVAEENR